MDGASARDLQAPSAAPFGQRDIVRRGPRDPAIIATIRAAFARRARKAIPHPTDPALALLPLQRAGLFAVIDAADISLVSGRNWQLELDKNGRPKCVKSDITLDGKRHCLKLHRVLLGNPSSAIDHRDRDVLNNRRSNLRLATSTQNACNKGTGAGRQFRGIVWHEQFQKWGVRVQVARLTHSFGLFLDPEVAARVYDAAARELHGEFASLNFPQEFLHGPHRWHQQKINAKSLIEFRGETKRTKEWAASLGMRTAGLLRRFKRGWSVAEALSTPSDTSNRPRGGRP